MNGILLLETGTRPGIGLFVRLADIFCPDNLKFTILPQEAGQEDHPDQRTQIGGVGKEHINQVARTTDKLIVRSGYEKDVLCKGLRLRRLFR